MLQPLAPDYTKIPENRLDAWQRIHKTQQMFWDRWRKEYLTEQQNRVKWLYKERNLQPGDLVILKNPLSPPAQWLLGRILRVFTGPDGLVRSAEVQTVAPRPLSRPIEQLIYLPVNSPVQEEDTAEVDPTNEAVEQ